MDSEPLSTDSDPEIQSKATPLRASPLRASTLTDAQLVSRGHIMYWIIAMIILVLVVIGMSVSEPAAPQSFGTVLNLGLLYLIWQGNNIARWIMVGTFSLLSTVLILVASAQYNPMGLVIGVVLMVVPMLLMTASVSVWMADRRAGWKAYVIEKIKKK
jgi:hypothetical protein